MKKSLSVYVRNNGELPFSDRYDGEDFTIEPGDALEIEADAAKLVFGFGEEDKSRAIRRLGWAPSSADMAGAMKRLYAFSFYSTREECESGIASPTADLSAPVGDADAAGTAQATPAAVGQQRAQIEAEVVVQPARRDERRPVNALENMARVANAAAG